MRFGGESAALAGFEIHDVIACPADIAIDIHIALAMMLENLFSALAQHVQRDSEAAVGRLRSRYRLEKKVDRRSALERRKLRGDVREATHLCRNFVCVHQAIQR